MTRTDLLATIRRLRTLEKAATVGPWREGRHDTVSYDATGSDPPFKNVYGPSTERHRGHEIPITVARGEGDRCIEDATLIAATRNALSTLLDELERRLVEERDEFMTDGQGNRWRLVLPTATDHEPVRGED